MENGVRNLAVAVTSHSGGARKGALQKMFAGMSFSITEDAE
jgi:hypothetical protein